MPKPRPVTIEDLAAEAQRLLQPPAQDIPRAMAAMMELLRRQPDHPLNGFYQMLLRLELLKAQGLPPVGPELAKSYERKMQDGFFRRWLGGENILDIGYKGNFYNAKPVLPHAMGVDFDTPGYDGLTLPFADASQDGVFSCHCLEHIPDPKAAVREWMRVLKTGGYLVVIVPHQHLYEKRPAPPSPWNDGHVNFFTPATLLAAVENALPANSYRLRHLADNDFAYDYAIGPERHAVGCYEIEMVLEKIRQPGWTI
ncbi:MAG TPA: class I SAM-dependent methyltransferase [Candidatus Sulfotelmatobacter sp.]|jgi:SAM-dependent methyltransferase|nr:class I SAM-dependent methyltransferase [Candidatus Sulfotelmatobacter sp.]